MGASAAAPDPRFLRGLADFNAGAFYEAHEAWEELWNDSEGEEKRLFQALVQLAAGYHKLEIGVRGGAVKLLGRALASLQEVRPACSPVALAALCVAVRRDLEILRVPGPLAAVAPPQLRVVE